MLLFVSMDEINLLFGSPIPPLPLGEITSPLLDENNKPFPIRVFSATIFCGMVTVVIGLTFP